MKHRIVPVVDGDGVSYIAQFKNWFFPRWRDDGWICPVMGGRQIITFASTTKARMWILENYGFRSEIVEYRP